MKFSEVVDQAAEMLRVRGRVSYRALQREFELDDPDLADLKEELLFTHPHLTDEAGRGAGGRMSVRRHLTEYREVEAELIQTYFLTFLIWLDCCGGKRRRPKPMISLLQSTAGLPKVLTRQICRTQKLYYSMFKFLDLDFCNPLKIKDLQE